jgi:hypothetical protein
MLQFLEWLACDNRTYADVMDGWRTTCPRLSIWEDALADGLIQVDGVGKRAQVTVTACGRSLLAANRS